MAKFLTTNGNSNYIEELIIDAKESLTLVSPYLNINKNFIDRLKDADAEGVKITLIYGKETLRDFEKEKLYCLNNLEIFFCSNLHAKCYHNNKKLIITSMNLIGFSEKNNREMGVLFDCNDDKEIFNETLKEIKSIINISKKEKSFTETNLSFDNEYKNTVVKKLEKTKAVQVKEITQPNIEQYSEDIKFHRFDNFYFPALANKLIKKYPKTEIIFDTEEFKFNILKNSGIEITITNRLDFYFKDENAFNSFENKNKTKVNQYLSKLRVYWNYKQINIYFPKNQSELVSKNTLIEKTDFYFNSISFLVDLISIT